MIALATAAAERAPLPDALTRAGIWTLVALARRKLASTPDGTEAGFAADFANHPIAVHTEDANAQHYELPPEFFALVLGPRRKYSSCLYDEGAQTLEAAEIFQLPLRWRFDEPGAGRGSRPGGDLRPRRPARRPGYPRAGLRLGFAQPVDGRAFAAGAHHRDGLRIVGQGKQEMFERRIFMVALVRERQRLMQAFFEVTRQHRDLLQATGSSSYLSRW